MTAPAITVGPETLRRALWIDPVSVEVDVVDGKVMLGGRVERRSTEGPVVRLSADVPGVVPYLTGDGKTVQAEVADGVVTLAGQWTAGPPPTSPTG